MSSNVLQPNPPHEPSFTLSHKNIMPEIPFCNPPKNPIFITVSQKNIIFHRAMWAFLGFCWLGQSFTEKTGKQEPSPPCPSLSLSFFLISFFPCPYCFSLYPPSFIIFLPASLSFLFPVFPSLSLFNFWFSCCGFFCFSLIR